MSQDNHIILAVHITDRVRHVPQIQAALTAYGDCIKTRLGLHEASPGGGSPNGLLILELLDQEAKARQLETALNAVDGVEIQRVTFTHPRP